MKHVRLKRILFAQNFTKSARTLWDELRDNKKLFAGYPDDGEAYALVSCSGNQIIFVLGEHDVTTNPKTRYEAVRKLLDFRCWRIDGGTFNPYMLENYGNSVGLSFGMRRLEELFRSDAE